MAPTILVAYDQPSTRAHLAGRLLDAGFEVVEARDGLEAWDQFRRHDPDLILADLRMPRCDGLELLERVRAQSAVPVIILTAYGDVPTAVRAMKSGAEQRDELVQALRETRGNLTQAAERLGISRGALRHRARKFGLLPASPEGR